MSKKEIKLTDNQQATVDKIKTRIGEYLSVRLGLVFRFVNQIPRSEIQIDFESETLPGKLCGVFQHIIESFTVDVVIWFEDEKFDRFTARTSFHYEHPGGGRNGFDIPIRLRGHLRGSKDKVYLFEGNE